ncbi:hypothetical protein [Streptomyces sp. NPDC056549]|uniref:hypothetical protein n=1 Tax=Streptomyces sp. NPDC056549 TaxID=3345864 RepID=UPI00369D38AD
MEATEEAGTVPKASERPFALVGSTAAYAHGTAVRLQHDTDSALLSGNADVGTESLREDGARIVKLPRTGS